VSSGDLAGIFPLVLIVLAFWFLVIRPSRKRQQETARIQSSVDVGAQVMLGSGVYGRVVGIGDDTLQLEVSPGTTIKVARQAVVRVVDSAEPTSGPGEASPKAIDEQ